MKVIAVLRKSNSLVYIRVRDGRGKDIKVSTSMYIDPIYWDSKIPGYKKEVRIKESKKSKPVLKEIISGLGTFERQTSNFKRRYKERCFRCEASLFS